MYDVRLNSNVTRGEVINTERGSVQVRLWLYHQEEPVEFKAEGDCLRDVAGSHFHFINRPLEPFQELDFSLDALTLLPGVTGEITASSRLCMHKPNELGEYGKPTYINVLRIELFTPQGRLILECFDCRVDVIHTAWVMTEDEEFAQKASNFSAWQEHIAKVPTSELEKNPHILAILYDEMHQRFGDLLDFDQHEAALLNWHGITSALAEEREINVLADDFSPDLPGSAPSEEFAGEAPESLSAEILDDFFADEAESDEGWAERKDLHPVLLSAQDLIQDFELQAAKLTFPRGRHYQALINTLDQIEDGLTDLLGASNVDEASLEKGMLGCREYLGKTLIAFRQLSQLMEITETTEGRRELLYLRDGMLELRESISALRFQLNNL